MLRLASDPVAIAVEVMRVGREHSEIPVWDVRTVEVRRRWRDADVGIRRVAVSGRRWRRRCTTRPSGRPELTHGAERIVGRRVAGGDHRRVGGGTSTIEDREYTAVWVVADLEVVLVDQC